MHSYSHPRKAETINRLLKKQSRPRNKRTNTTDMPASGARTPKVKKAQEDGEEAEGDEDEEDEATELVEPPEEVKPVMYRWVSSLRNIPTAEGEQQKVEMGITFSVPETLFVDPQVVVQPVDEPELEKIRMARGPGICAVAGCGKPRKYRVPKDWTIGACDSNHLRLVANSI